ncbi:FtsX-like permease family protein [Gordonia sp. ABSL1-1]|uniref:FtsX-like permease family protein n=1 Tax=Gordonia sp. ABSL1-1 TaxID=3053923 RepID=UPI0025740E37|nr:FtsX-like permease family protein [Gordonia sp. ABSL1-1]MDL9936068.1 FtsX-like permease family protein [Gordonia sp. ABSL1-1]
MADGPGPGRSVLAPVRALAAGLTRIRVLNLREIRHHRLRVVTSLAVVIVSSALLIAVLSTYGSLTESVRQFNAAITGSAQVEVAAITDSGVDEQVAADLRRGVPDAKAVVPLIRNTIVVGDKRIILLGSDFRVGALSDDLQAAAGSGQALFAQRDSGIVVGSGTGLRKGQQISVGGIDLTVVEVVGGDAAAALNKGNFAFAYLPLAQRLTGLDGRLDSILIVGRPGADTARLRADAERVVNGRAAVVDPDFRAQQAEVASSVTWDSTLLVSLVSLVIAAFLMFNTMNMAVASRRSSLAMIRALGARRRHLVGDLLGEAALFGVVGGLIGVPLGILAGRWAISRLPEPTGNEVSATVDFYLPGYAPVVAVAACVIACVAATSLAARSVFAVSPVEAMVPGDVADASSRRWLAVTFAALGGIGALIGSVVVVATVPGRPAILAGAVYAIGALLVCYALSAPLGRLVVAVAQWFRGPGRLAAVNTERAPRRAWATLMTVAVAIAVGMGTSGALDNLISSVSRSLDGLGDPDFYVSSSTEDAIPLGPVLPPEVRAQVARVPGVDKVVGGQWAAVNIGADRALLQGLEPDSKAPFMRKASPQAVAQVLAGDGILLSNVLARILDVEVGDPVRIATPTGYHETIVRDTVDYVSVDSGTAAIASSLMATWFDRPGDTYLQVLTTPGADEFAVRSALERISAAHPMVGNKPIHVYSGAQALAATQASVEQAGAFTIAIQWIVALAAAVALLNTLLLSVIERRRELGVLRAMGASRRFVRRMVLAEAAAVALVGSAVGLILGSALHLLSNHILGSTTALDVVYEFRPSTLVFVAVAVALCLVGAVVPAIRAARMNISESILSE